MLILFKRYIPLMLICLSQPANAALYKCEKDGNITFSDKPCSGQLQDITDQHSNSIPKRNTSSSSAASRAEKSRKLTDEMRASRIKRQVNRQIKALETEIDDSKKARDAELQALEVQQQSIGHGDDDDFDDELLTMELKKNISDKMNDVKKSYSSEIEALNNKINSLRKKLSTAEP